MSDNEFGYGFETSTNDSPNDSGFHKSVSFPGKSVSFAPQLTTHNPPTHNPQPHNPTTPQPHIPQPTSPEYSVPTALDQSVDNVFDAIPPFVTTKLGLIHITSINGENLTKKSFDNFLPLNVSMKNKVIILTDCNFSVAKYIVNKHPECEYITHQSLKTSKDYGETPGSGGRGLDKHPNIEHTIFIYGNNLDILIDRQYIYDKTSLIQNMDEESDYEKTIQMRKNLALLFEGVGTDEKKWPEWVHDVVDDIFKLPNEYDAYKRIDFTITTFNDIQFEGFDSHYYGFPVQQSSNNELKGIHYHMPLSDKDNSINNYFLPKIIEKLWGTGDIPDFICGNFNLYPDPGLDTILNKALADYEAPPGPDLYLSNTPGPYAHLSNTPGLEKGMFITHDYSQAIILLKILGNSLENILTTWNTWASKQPYFGFYDPTHPAFGAIHDTSAELPEEDMAKKAEMATMGRAFATRSYIPSTFETKTRGRSSLEPISNSETRTNFLRSLWSQKEGTQKGKEGTQKGKEGTQKGKQKGKKGKNNISPKKRKGSFGFSEMLAQRQREVSEAMMAQRQREVSDAMMAEVMMGGSRTRRLSKKFRKKRIARKINSKKKNRSINKKKVLKRIRRK